jgi:hypothetical protein
MTRAGRARVGRGSSIALLLLAVLGVLAVLAQGASLPHTHEVSAPGLYNEEHDLSLLATRGADAPLPAALPIVHVVASVAAWHAPVPPAPPALLCPHADFRAPPLA